MRTTAALLTLIASLSTTIPAGAQTPSGATFDESVAPGRNYDKAEFRLDKWQWLVTERP